MLLLLFLSSVLPSCRDLQCEPVGDKSVCGWQQWGVGSRWKGPGRAGLLRASELGGCGGGEEQRRQELGLRRRGPCKEKLEWGQSPAVCLPGLPSLWRHLPAHSLQSDQERGVETSSSLRRQWKAVIKCRSGVSSFHVTSYIRPNSLHNHLEEEERDLEGRSGRPGGRRPSVRRGHLSVCALPARSPSCAPLQGVY